MFGKRLSVSFYLVIVPQVEVARILPAHIGISACTFHTIGSVSQAPRAEGLLARAAEDTYRKQICIGGGNVSFW